MNKRQGFYDLRLTPEFLRDAHPAALDAFLGGEARRVLSDGRALLIRTTDSEAIAPVDLPSPLNGAE